MEPPRAPESRRRETRLLISTIAVSALMLLLLARFRFPQPPTEIVEPAAPPLERLAARATYDELTAILRGVLRQVGPAIVTVPVTPVAGSLTGQPGLVPAVRLSDDRALALTGRDRLVQLPAEGDVTVVATDGPRGLVLLKVAGQTGLAPRLAPLDGLGSGPGYVAAVEATAGGAAIRPLYFGRLDRINDRRWEGTVLRFSALQQLLPSGAAVFTLDGRFIGLGFPEARDLIVVSGPILMGEAERLARDGSVTAATAGLRIQALTDSLRAATGASSGVIVSGVRPGGPSADAIVPGDVITRIGSTDIRTPADYDQAADAFVPGTAVGVTIVRQRATATVTITPVAEAPSAGAPSTTLGLTLQTVRGVGSEVLSVVPQSVAARAGIQRGDLITRFADVTAPDPARISRTFTRASTGTSLVVVLERNSSPLVVGLVKP